MASILEQLQVKYKSREYDKSTDSTKTVVTYQGSRELCEEYMSSHSPGSVDPELGSLDSMKMTQDEGPFWNVTVTWLIDRQGGTSHASHTGTGPETSTLSMNMLGLPLETRPNYARIWNYNLYSTVKYSKANSTQKGIGGWIKQYAVGFNQDGSPKEAIEQENIYTPNLEGEPDYYTTHIFFCWAKSYADCPTLDDPSQTWYKWYGMTKEGIEYYNYPVYTLTERSLHYTRNSAGWIMSKKAGKITRPEYGDFGVTRLLSGDWLCEGGDISYDGRYWIASRTYTHSPDSEKGWDKDLYDLANPAPSGIV